MLLVSRCVRKIQERGDAISEQQSLPLQDLRNHAAWVLLGEPGAGKSSAFAQEAEATGGLHLSIAEFLIDEPQDEWRGKPLFLDGLDEIRASGSGDSILLRVRSRLKRLGNPIFRIACRAADWFGSTDIDAIKAASPDGQLAVLLLEPLRDKDILDVLRQNHAVDDPDGFAEKAGKHGVDDLLDNPQTLGLLADAIHGEQWPASRQKTFELACEKLADEPSRVHRDRQRSHPQSRGDLLDAAGHLCAALLLADKTGIALDRESADERFSALEDFFPPDLAMAQGALRRVLFRPSASGADRFVPKHRSIAEYLAARWLARQVDHGGLPLGRILNLLQGMDGRTVAGLRGLYGWLALHCHAARSLLIAADPLTVIVYGDVKPMSCGDKRSILVGLQREAERHPAFCRELETSHSFGALADPTLAGDFITALESTDRNAAAQSFVDCVLSILAEGQILPALTSTVKSLVLDDSRWNWIRASALQVWLKQGAPVREAVSLLDAIADGQITDNDDELAGFLLHHLYPNSLEPAALMRYLHLPKDRQLTGSYSWFWSYELPRKAPAAHLPLLLDRLAARCDLSSPEEREFSVGRMLDALLVRGIELHGEQASDERLFRWLGIGVDEYGVSIRGREAQQAIANWLGTHPERYKALLALCYRQCERDENPHVRLHAFERRLHGAAAPQDIGQWHLEQVSQTANDALAENHLSKAVSALIRPQGNAGLTLEAIEAWGENHPEKKHWLERLLVSEISNWRAEAAVRKANYEQQRVASRRQRSVQLSRVMDDIRKGVANVALMQQLAGVWLNRYTDVSGETPAERFDNYSENGAEVLLAAESGFRLCPQRDNLPAVADIIELGTKQKEHLIRLPCLIGMALRWQDGPKAIDMLSDETLRRMAAFRLTHGVGVTPAWFVYLVEKRPMLVAEVLVDYASVTFKSKGDFVDGISPLAHDPAYGAVARIAAPRLLERFPLRSRSGQLSHLEHLLKAALRHSPEALAALVERKVATRSLDAAQKVYWFTAGMLLAPEKYEAALWEYVGNSSSRANYLAGFLSKRFGDLDSNYEFSARTIGKLIELLTPHAELNCLRGGWVDEAMQCGDHVRALVRRLSVLATPEAAQEIERLLILPGLSKLKFQLEDSRHQLRLRQREEYFRFPSLAGVAQILANREPIGAADLAALALDHLDDIARKIRQDNSDLFRLFWSEVPENTPKPENSCRDALRLLLESRLSAFNVECQSEGDCFNDKRADIRLSCRNEIELPIEIKKESNDSLWTALRKQLIGQYAIASKAAGHGIYLVLWFGGERQARPRDGGKRLRSAAELQTRLEAQLDQEERKRIFIRVLDVSWPNKA